MLCLHYDRVLHLVKSDFTSHLPIVGLYFLVEFLFISGHSLKWVITYLFNVSLAYGLAPKLTGSLALTVWILEFIAKNISKYWLSYNEEEMWLPQDPYTLALAASSWYILKYALSNTMLSNLVLTASIMKNYDRHFEINRLYCREPSHNMLCTIACIPLNYEQAIRMWLK